MAIRGGTKLTLLKVGLYSTRGPGDVYRPSPDLPSIRLVSAQTLGADGRFHFANLSAGRYQLAFMVSGDLAKVTKKNLQLQNHPGDIEVKPGRRQLVLKTIVITVE